MSSQVGKVKAGTGRRCRRQEGFDQGQTGRAKMESDLSILFHSGSVGCPLEIQPGRPKQPATVHSADTGQSHHLKAAA